MYLVLSCIHVIACFMLILAILLQAGRGGGLSDMFGAGMQQQQKLFGSESNVVLTKATTACAVIFVITSLVLGLMTTQKSRSIITPQALKPMFPATEASAQASAASETPKAAPGTPAATAPVPAKKE